MDLEEILYVPRGKFRVFGRDNFSDEYFIVDDYEAPWEAIAIAKLKEQEEKKINPDAGEIATTFHVVDSNLNFLYNMIEIE